MSIYCTTFDVGADHSNKCARVRKIRRNVYQQDDSKPCTCGASPLRYQGSHILPSDTDERGGVLMLGAIPPHITRYGRDDAPEDGRWYPWLRVSLFAGENDSVLLTRNQVEKLRDALNEWLNKTRPSGKGDILNS